jgi:hypothetical protein
MPYLEPPVEASLSTVGDPLGRFLPWLELRDVLRQTLQIADLSSAPGWPRGLSAEIAGRWFSGPQLLCTFSNASRLDAPGCYVALPVDQAVALADLCLGGEGRAGVACAAGAPDEAECGVLAYLAARCVRICAAPLQLRDVAAHPARELASWPDAMLLWPLRIKLGTRLELELALLMAADSPLAQQPLRARLVLGDEVDPAALAALQPHDLLLCESWPGQLTSQGLSGALELRVEALPRSLPVALEGGRIRALRDSQADGRGLAGPCPDVRASARGRAARNDAELVLSELELSLADLAQLTGGQAGLAAPLLEHAYVTLAGEPRAHGRLVRYGGAIALEVLGLGAVPSMR